MKVRGFTPAQQAIRRASLPRPTLNADLPVLAARDEILAAIRQHPVVIISGETGSGKTTQLPQLCLWLERGISGVIGCTQPRRVAARSVAQRLAQELGCPLGDQVGYQVRFHDHVSERSLIKVMTEGILLAEISSDPELRRYDTLILDEVHERSLNMDFLLGYLKSLLPRRPDLKIVLTSATLDTERLSAHFGHAPLIEVSGRTWPVEIRWRPITADHLDDETDEDLETQALIHAVDELTQLPPGDILVFLPGEREIRRAADALRQHHPDHTEILPLFARQSFAEQERVFQPALGRRIILSTNVAETSLTVPGVRYVIDTGLARISRYSLRTKVTQLRVEPISQAAARQRAGRCGRLSSGVCIRLYSEVDHASRPSFTQPEILRSSLASVILRLSQLNIGGLDTLPLLDRPGTRAIEEGYRQLQTLDAMDEQRQLTRLGHDIAPLPLDPRLGRMVLAAREKGCLHEILILVAAMSVQDPRERPFQDRQKADMHHRQWLRDGSEFLALLEIWATLQETLIHKKSRQLASFCRQHYLSTRRVREWRDVLGQLKGWVSERGWLVNTQPAPKEQIHRALLTGLLDQIGQWDREAQNYLGPRGIRFWLAGSSKNKERPRWIMAGEMAETDRIQARLSAPIQPEWIEEAAHNLLQRSYGDPYWDESGEQINAYEKVSLFGLTLVARRPVRYGPINPEEAHLLFIRHGLVANKLRDPPNFIVQNQSSIESILELEHKRRRQGFLIDDDDLVAFYADRLPSDVWSSQRLKRWLHTRPLTNPDPLLMTAEFLMRHRLDDVPVTLYPDHLEWKDQSWPLSYRFEPGHPLDGVTLTLPREALPLIEQLPLDWLVPGLIRDKLTACFKALPSPQRRALVPLPASVTAFLERHGPSQGALFPQLDNFVRQRTGHPVPTDLTDQLPPHLIMRLVLLDEHGEEWQSGRNLAALRQAWSNLLQQDDVTLSSPDWVTPNLTQWSFGDWPHPTQLSRGTLHILVYPALIDRGDKVDLLALDSAEEARTASHAGLRRLARLGLRSQLSKGPNTLPGLLELLTLCQSQWSGMSAQILFERLVDLMLHAWHPDAAPLPLHQADYQQRLQSLKAQWRDKLSQQIMLVQHILSKQREIQERTKRLESQRDIQTHLRHIHAHLHRLVEEALDTALPYENRRHIPRYLQSLLLRLDKLLRDPVTDTRKFGDWLRLQQRWQSTLQQKPSHPALLEFRWMLEEWHVALFAQSLPTAYPVSLQRLEKFWHQHF